MVIFLFQTCCSASVSSVLVHERGGPPRGAECCPFGRGTAKKDHLHIVNASQSQKPNLSLSDNVSISCLIYCLEHFSEKSPIVWDLQGEAACFELVHTLKHVFVWHLFLRRAIIRHIQRNKNAVEVPGLPRNDWLLSVCKFEVSKVCGGHMRRKNSI